MKIAWIVGASVVAVGCSTTAPPLEPNCGDVGVPAITVTPLDYRTDQPIQRQAVVIARDGGYADTAHAEPGMRTVGVAYNRAGSYSVTVTAPGYALWQREPVVVLQGRCNVSTIPLAARLVLP